MTSFWVSAEGKPRELVVARTAAEAARIYAGWHLATLFDHVVLVEQEVKHPHDPNVVLTSRSKFSLRSRFVAAWTAEEITP